MWDGGDEAIESTWKENKCKKNQEKLSWPLLLQVGVVSAGSHSWRAFSDCAHCANLNKGAHSLQSSTGFSEAHRLSNTHLHVEPAAVFTGNSVLSELIQRKQRIHTAAFVFLHLE